MNNNKENQQNLYYDEYEIDLREYIMLLWENKLFIIGLTVVAVLIAYIYSANFITPQYRNSLTVQLSNTEGVYSETEAMDELIKSDELIRPALERKNINSGVISNLSTSTRGPEYGGIITLEAENSDQEKLTKALNAVVEEFEARSNDYFSGVLREKRNNLLAIENEIDNLDKEIEKTNEILNNLEDISVDKAFIIANINDKLNTLSETKREYLNDYRELEREINDHREFRVLNFPSETANKIGPNTKLNVAIAAVLALMLAVFIVFFREFMKEE